MVRLSQSKHRLHDRPFHLDAGDDLVRGRQPLRSARCRLPFPPVRFPEAPTSGEVVRHPAEPRPDSPARPRRGSQGDQQRLLEHIFRLVLVRDEAPSQPPEPRGVFEEDLRRDSRRATHGH